MLLAKDLLSDDLFRTMWEMSGPSECSEEATTQIFNELHCSHL
jgi:hypothetical protein